MEIKNVTFIGCGALGIMYASHLLKTLDSDSVQFIADRDRIKRYAQTEFFANGIRQSFRFVPPDADAAPSDLVIFTVKSYDLPGAVRMAKGYIGDDTIILSFLNGIQSEGVIGKSYNPHKVFLSMVAGMDATKTDTSVRYSQIGYVAFGGQEGSDPEDLKALARFFDRVQFPYELDEDIIKTMWGKYMLNTGINPTSALLRATYSLFQNSGYAKEIMLMSMREVYEVSQKLHIGLDESDIVRAVEIIDTLSPDGKTSMFQDVFAHRQTEIDIFSGTLIKLAKEHGVDVPVNTFLYNAIKALER